MNPTATIAAETTRFLDLRRRLIADHPDLDDDTLADTLEGATNLHEAIAALVRSALEDEAMARGLKGRLEDLTARLGRIEERAARKREIALHAMDEAGLSKITAPDVTISLRAGPASLVITDESLIPEWFFVPQPAKLDRRKVLEVLKAGMR